VIVALGALLAAMGQAAFCGEPAWVGYGGPLGSRVYANATPPTKTFKVAWTTPLPSWGHGQPLAIAGRVFVLAEPRPDQVFPCLSAYDQATGKRLWERPLDHLAAAKAEDARKDLEAWFANQAALLKQESGDRDPAAVKEHRKRAQALSDRCGFQYDNWRTVWCLEWGRTLCCIGEVFGTPVSDGKRVWVNTSWGGFFAFDLDGKTLWTTYAPRPQFYTSQGTQRARSLILHKELLICDQFNFLRVFDAPTGKLLWSRDQGKGVESMATPTVLTIGGKDVLITAGPAAYLLPDGKPLQVEGWDIPGMQLLTHPTERDVLLSCGCGEHCGWPGKGVHDTMPPAAWRFAWHGNLLKATRLWHSGDLPNVGAKGGEITMGGTKPWLMVHNNRLYHPSGAILDALTGKILAGEIAARRARTAVPDTSHFLLWANGHVYGLNKKGMAVCTDDGKPVATHTIEAPALAPEQLKVIEWATGSEKTLDSPRKGGDLSLSFTFTFDGKRIFVRSYMHLICIE
jgi:outer membrane protein assembly factor BamB